MMWRVLLQGERTPPRDFQAERDNGHNARRVWRLDALQQLRKKDKYE